jgi:sulfite exporter TauE/SafE
MTTRLPRSWLHHRSSTRLAASHVNRQRHRSLVLLLFSVARIIAWTILGAAVGAGLLGTAGFGWAKDLSESVPFVALISLYANWATDVGTATAAFAALVASDSHAAVVATGQMLEADLEALQSDVDRLAGLGPGQEAADLAASIHRKLTAAPRT